ncbi:hypothetical protein [Nocardia sp. N2S4-5]|uniref:hypothetical protein n=1 Tax=Nocardia sp. N2S4-5 TaxID=3351565 RepID=UPI0037D90986
MAEQHFGDTAFLLHRSVRHLTCHLNAVLTTVTLPIGFCSKAVVSQALERSAHLRGHRPA